MAKKHVTTTELIKTTQTTITETTIEEHALPTLEIIEGKVFCTSLKISEHFEKEHFIVLRDIEEQIAKIKAGRHAGSEESMFLKGFYETQAGFGKVKKPMYYLNRDGFMKLVMGYNGAKASDIQMDYIEAFNKMEAMLLNLMESPKTISSDQIRHLTGQISLIAGWFHMNNASHWLNNLLRFHLNTNSINDIRAEDYPKAQALIENARRQGEEYLQMRIDIEKEILLDYLCQGIPFTPTLRKQATQKLKAKLPSYPNWKEIALQLELKAA